MGVSASDLAIVLNLRRATGNSSRSLRPLSAASVPLFICFKQTTAKCRKSFACAASLHVSLCVCVGVCLQGVCVCVWVCACLDGFVDLWPDCKCIKCQRKHCNLLPNPAQTPPKWSAEATTLLCLQSPYKCHAPTLDLPSVSSACVCVLLVFWHLC